MSRFFQKPKILEYVVMACGFWAITMWAILLAAVAVLTFGSLRFGEAMHAGVEYVISIVDRILE